MIDVLTAPYGVLLQRWCLGAMFIAHAMYKWRVDTAGEFTGASCLILGIYPRYAALFAVFLIGDGALTLVASPNTTGVVYE